MYSNIDQILDEAKKRIGIVDIPNNILRASLSKKQYQAMLQILHEMLDKGISDEVVFVVRMYFCSKWAQCYYREVFDWMVEHSNGPQAINYEGCVEETYHKREAEWTMGRLNGLPPERWPSSILRFLIRDLGDREDLMNGIFELLEKSHNSVYILCNLIETRHPRVLSKIDAMIPLPRLVRKCLDTRLGRARMPIRGNLKARDLATYTMRYSTEIDDDKVIDAIHAGYKFLQWEWSEDLAMRAGAVRGDAVPAKGYSRLLSAIECGEERAVVASREDDTTLVVMLLSRPTAIIS